MNMDLSKVFRALCYVVMVLGGLLLLIAILTVVGVGAATAEADAVTRGGFTFFTAFALIPYILLGIIGVLAGRAGLQSDPYRCRKLSIVLAVLAVLDLLTAIRTGNGIFMNVVSLAIYGGFCYLAHTESY